MAPHWSIKPKQKRMPKWGRILTWTFAAALCLGNLYLHMWWNRSDVSWWQAHLKQYELAKEQGERTKTKLGELFDQQVKNGPLKQEQLEDQLNGGIGFLCDTNHFFWNGTNHPYWIDAGGNRVVFSFDNQGYWQKWRVFPPPPFSDWFFQPFGSKSLEGVEAVRRVLLGPISERDEIFIPGIIGSLWLLSVLILAWWRTCRRVLIEIALATALAYTACWFTYPGRSLFFHPVKQLLSWILGMPLASAFLLVWILISTRPHKFPLCPICGYNLTANTSGKCPECGNFIPDEYKERLLCISESGRPKP